MANYGNVGAERCADERGANIVEFAIVAPLLFLLIFGIIDFGWAFSQHLDVKHGAREGARLAVVNAGVGGGTVGRDDLITKIRARTTELSDDLTEVYVNLADEDGDGTAGELGESAIVCLSYPLNSLTGLSDEFLSGTLSAKVVMRMEQPANFSPGGSSNPTWTGGPCTT